MIIFETERERFIWLACLIDGEGSIQIARSVVAGRKSPRYLISLVISSTKLEILQLAHHITQIGVVKPAGTPLRHAKQGYVWIAKSQQAVALLRQLQPFFVLKARQAQLAIRMQESYNTIGRPGEKGLPTEVIQYRDSLKVRLNVLNKRGTFETL